MLDEIKTRRFWFQLKVKFVPSAGELSWSSVYFLGDVMRQYYIDDDGDLYLIDSV